ncbi:flagellar hook-basal body complex protein [Ideonella azotifigens]|uniref:Flagellar hook protein FlgE n=1 Tax=Ideonella azotifigens TaxID=513160 RepID=A0ABN1K977_9BURK|nr:flagellar hook-basal body complex protein [Ideonella azotifigens]MCD2339096.1 flagellar hook-basal body complex protein [Ideonella azotifigens]
MSFEIALSGINAVNTQLDSISNNIANSGTYGFKSSRANFSAMVAGSSPTGAEIGSLTQSIGTGGSTLSTGRSLDAAIQGRGFFALRDSTGLMSYSRVGNFVVDKTGMLVDASGRKVQGYAVTPGSTALGAMGDISVPSGQIAAKASSKLSYVANMSKDWTTPTLTPFDKTDAQTFNSSMVSVVYDSLGTQHTMTQYFVKSGSNAVDVHYTMDGNDLGTTNTLSFSTNGVLTAPAGAVTLALGTPDGASALSIDVDYTGTTLYAGEATNSVNAADGYASGTLTGTTISDDGSVLAQYSNGQKQTIAKLALATFPSEDGLTPTSDTSWTASQASGQALYYAPGTGMAGSLTVGALEQSNVDMTGELVNLMSAQRNYQANTKVISAESEMMQALFQAV